MYPKAIGQTDLAYNTTYYCPDTVYISKSRRSFLDRVLEAQNNELLQLVQESETLDLVDKPDILTAFHELFFSKLINGAVSHNDSLSIWEVTNNQFLNLDEYHRLKSRELAFVSVKKSSLHFQYEPFEQGVIRKSVRDSISLWRAQMSAQPKCIRPQTKDKGIYLVLPSLSLKEFIFLTNLDEETGISVFSSGTESFLCVTDGVRERIGFYETFRRHDLSVFSTSNLHTHVLEEDEALEFSGSIYQHNLQGDIALALPSVVKCNQVEVLTSIRQGKVECLAVFPSDLTDDDRDFFGDVHFKSKNGQLPYEDEKLTREINKRLKDISLRAGTPIKALKKAGVIHPDEMET